MDKLTLPACNYLGRSSQAKELAILGRPYLLISLYGRRLLLLFLADIGQGLIRTIMTTCHKLKMGVGGSF